MKFIKNIFDKNKPLFEKGGKFEKLMPLFETFETLFFVPDEVTLSRGVQVKDAVDLKRMMMTVIIAMVPALLFGIWNVGYQHGLATGEELKYNVIKGDLIDRVEYETENMVYIYHIFQVQHNALET